MTLARQTPAPDFLALLAGRANADGPGIKPRLPSMYESRQREGSTDELPIGHLSLAAPTPPPPEPDLAQSRPALNASNTAIEFDRKGPGRKDAGPSYREGRSMPKALPRPHQDPLKSIEAEPIPEPRASTSRPLIAQPVEPRWSQKAEPRAQPPPTFLPEGKKPPKRVDQLLVVPTGHGPLSRPIGLTPVTNERSNLASALDRNFNGRPLLSRNEADAQSDQVINITIGRIEVCAGVPAAPARSPTPLPRRDPPQSLTDYLKSRERGR